MPVKSRGGTKLNTAFIERLNDTFRARLAVLVRRSRALIRNPQTLEPLAYLLGSVYNFYSEHQSLRLKLWAGSSYPIVDYGYIISLIYKLEKISSLDVDYE